MMKHATRGCIGIVLCLSIALLMGQAAVYSQGVKLYTDASLADEGLKAYKSENYLKAAIYFFAYIQRDPANPRWSKEDLEAAYVDAFEKTSKIPKGTYFKGDYLEPDPEGKIILFEDAGFEGRSRIITHDVSYLEGFNDETTSLIVISGKWALYRHASGKEKRHTPIGTVSVYGGPDKDGCYPGTEYWKGANNDISAVYFLRSENP